MFRIFFNPPRGVVLSLAANMKPSIARVCTGTHTHHTHPSILSFQSTHPVEQAAVSALEEVCYVLGKDKTYEEMKERMMPPPPPPPPEAADGASTAEKSRRDYLAEENMIVGGINKFEEGAAAGG